MEPKEIFRGTSVFLPKVSLLAYNQLKHMIDQADILDRVQKFCQDAHRGQFRRNGKPYITHPFSVQDQCVGFLEKILGWMHDIIEDTHHSFEDCQKFLIEAGLEDDDVLEVISGLRAISREPEEQYMAYIFRVSNVRLARDVKIEDLKHNLTDCRPRHVPRYTIALSFLQGKIGQ
jgi:(p)ppGpp synthase/HD superfamily hydrolase